MRNGFRPPVPQAASIPGPVGVLEARIEDPSPGSTPRAVGVVCHPHPLHGGTMQNKVVHTLARAMQELGVPTVRFNFRGVGKSDGAYGAGAGEAEDAIAVTTWARDTWACRRVWLAGFSFGAAVALRAAPEIAPAKLVTVAPPVGRLPVAGAPSPVCPWLVVHGERDALVECAAVRAWAEACVPRPEIAVMRDTDHFFHGKLGELRAVVIEFLSGDSAFGG